MMMNKPFWFSGLWATFQGGKMSKAYNHTTHHRGILAIHFVKVKWYLLMNSSKC
jgi:hypothetical protein